MDTQEAYSLENVELIADGNARDAVRSLKIRTEQCEGRLERVVLSSEKDVEIQIRNQFRTELIAVTDDIPVGRFGDFIQRLFRCERGAFLRISVKHGVTYTVTAVI